MSDVEKPQKLSDAIEEEKPVHTEEAVDEEMGAPELPPESEVVVEEEVTSSPKLDESLTDELVKTINTKKFDFLTILMKVFDFIDNNEQIQKVLKVSDRMITIRAFMQSSVDKLMRSKPALHEKYSELIDGLFADTYDFGMVISLIMKLIQEVSKFRKMDGPAKKQIGKIIFDRILEYSPLNEEQMQIAHYSYSGIVEAIIWAKHGGLKTAKKNCMLMCK